MAAMAHVDAEGIRAREKQLGDHLRRRTGRPKRRQYANLAFTGRKQDLHSQPLRDLAEAA
jgi:hypothetical protein